MKRINSSSIPADPPTDQVNGFRIWEKPSAKGMKITMQSVHSPECAVQTEVKMNTVAFSINGARRSLMQLLEQLEQANTPHP